MSKKQWLLHGIAPSLRSGTVTPAAADMLSAPSPSRLITHPCHPLVELSPHEGQHNKLLIQATALPRHATLR